MHNYAALFEENIVLQSTRHYIPHQTSKKNCVCSITELNNIVEHESGVTMLKNIVDNIEQLGQNNILINIATSCSTTSWVRKSWTTDRFHSVWLLSLLRS